MMKYFTLLLLVIVIFFACQKKDFSVEQVGTDGYEELFDIDPEVFFNIQKNSYTTELPEYLKVVGMRNPALSNVMVGLGRVLFYDKNLSRDRSIACASCHQQKFAFSDNVAFSPGVEGRLSNRNAMPLGNVTSFAAHYSVINSQVPSLLWDCRATNISEQSPFAFMNPLEMDMPMPEVIARIKENPYYSFLWKEAFGDFDVTKAQVLTALNQFVGAIRSYNSPFDRAMTANAGDISGTTDTIVTQIYYGTETTIITTLPFFSQSEFRGLRLFVDNCSKCHSPIRPFQEVFAACTGLEKEYKDQGLGSITGRASDNGVFKSPPLRNITLTAPYMHDGRFKTLEEVVEFYNSGIQDHPNLDPLLRDGKGAPKRLKLTAQQKTDLVTFMHMLTDESIKYDTRFSNPFK